MKEVLSIVRRDECDIRLPPKREENFSDLQNPRVSISNEHGKKRG
jgi:hypothetical protein